MTNREFYTAVIEGLNTEEMRQHASDAIGKLDARNARKTSKPSKTQTENIPVKNAIREFIANNEGVCTASTVAAGLEISVQKASALCRQMVTEDVLSVEDVKIPKKGLQKGYRVK
jgi:hypothetical protein